MQNSIKRHNGILHFTSRSNKLLTTACYIPVNTVINGVLMIK